MAQIATVMIQGEKIILTGVGRTQENRVPPNRSWLQKLENTTLGTTWNLKVRSRGSMDNIRQAIVSNHAIMVSDGSFQNQCSTCAWIIEGKNSADRIKGQMQTPGQLQDHSSFRSKAAGIYRALLMLWSFSQDYPLTGQITLACNGQSVLDRLRSHKSIDPFAAHVDLLRACKNIQSWLPCQIKYNHVKGHQDNGYPTVLSQEAWLNIKTDLAAKGSINYVQQEDPQNPLPFEPWQLLINQEKIVKHHQCAL